MKTLLFLAILLVGLTFSAVAQSHEYAPLLEKEISYKDVLYNNVYRIT